MKSTRRFDGVFPGTAIQAEMWPGEDRIEILIWPGSTGGVDLTQKDAHQFGRQLVTLAKLMKRDGK